VELLENKIARQIVDAALHVHKTLGPGLLESVYEAVLSYELKKRGFSVEQQVSIPVVYESVEIETGFRADLIVEDKIIIELKSVDKIHDVHKKQLLTYLKISNKQLGLLINFNELLLKNGIRRIVNGLPE
jgi:GxxExxY protein